MRHDAFICGTWLIHMRHCHRLMCNHAYEYMCHIWMWRDAFIREIDAFRRDSFTWDNVIDWHAITDMNTRPTYECDMTYWYVRRNSFIWDIVIDWRAIMPIDTFITYECGMTHSYLRLPHSYAKRDSFTWDIVIDSCALTHKDTCVAYECGRYARHDAFKCMTWLIHMRHSHRLIWVSTYKYMSHIWMRHDTLVWPIERCGMTHSYVWCDSFICETWLIHTLDMTHSYVRRDSFICETWLIHMWDMTHSCVGHDSFICGTWLIHTLDMTHSYVRRDSFM